MRLIPNIGPATRIVYIVLGLGLVLLSGATRLLLLILFFSGLAALMVELEERELRARLGQAYADYCRRVPRFIPRWQAPAEKTGD